MLSESAGHLRQMSPGRRSTDYPHLSVPPGVPQRPLHVRPASDPRFGRMLQLPAQQGSLRSKAVFDANYSLLRSIPLSVFPFLCCLYPEHMTSYPTGSLPLPRWSVSPAQAIPFHGAAFSSRHCLASEAGVHPAAARFHQFPVPRRPLPWPNQVLRFFPVQPTVHNNQPALEGSSVHLTIPQIQDTLVKCRPEELWMNVLRV